MEAIVKRGYGDYANYETQYNGHQMTSQQVVTRLEASNPNILVVVMRFGMIILTSMKQDSLLTISLNAFQEYNQLQNVLGGQTVQLRPCRPYSTNKCLCPI